MKPPKPASPLAGSVEPRPAARPAVVRFAAKTLAIADMEVRKLRHDPTELATRAVQPALWLLIFGQVMSRARLIETGGLPYLDFITPGILAQSVLFIAIFNGISVIWEKDLGIVHKFLASPTPRAALVLGKALGGGVRALVQAAVVIALAALLGVRLNTDPQAWAGLVLFVVLGAAVFSSFSLIIACLVKTRERFMGVGQLLTMPLFFASNAIYPTAMMPRSLQVISHLNPLTYQVDALRTLLLPGFSSAVPYGLGADFVILIATLAALVAISARMYPHIAQ
ncbi:MAG: ABC transporter permease [Burkholderia sp.]|jgi:ABC-2 type transport system permease protein|uniref:ABC transporter permease n=2 Tax=Burkholderiaceae TaxID=119060 RepID=UPI001453BB49|nr:MULTISPECIES: ABC transporter permease [Burkholderia]MCA3781043.1 ABC transporter permease [Burkholderia sp.]MCA3798231.1 ABC transporter permease [Burkholderia sp.]MCA3802137.1 ABC transporter permease [Burkholderia sp.]MCA3813898.1 ABC transporter permease [Burkholderia sp.]MCA3815698.1 ABC transporter permease [Burkholderia sp.]